MKLKRANRKDAQKTADLATFTEEKFIFCAVYSCQRDYGAAPKKKLLNSSFFIYLVNDLCLNTT